MSGKPVVGAKPRRGRRRKAGDIATLRRVMWAGLLEAERILNDPETDAEMRLSAISRLATLGGVYNKVTKDHELEERLEALWKEVHELQTTAGRPAGAGGGSAAATAN